MKTTPHVKATPVAFRASLLQLLLALSTHPGPHPPAPRGLERPLPWPVCGPDLGFPEAAIWASSSPSRPILSASSSQLSAASPQASSFQAPPSCLPQDLTSSLLGPASRLPQAGPLSPGAPASHHP
ncbi:unnamed protein product [Pipistrellus nathusii]|uniref:Uncharacterized protein n=1 Tax=Pipistrellus nathusii TaxID=59473 RepID=A0ABN9ZS67_PIPNA